VQCAKLHTAEQATTEIVRRGHSISGVAEVGPGHRATLSGERRIVDKEIKEAFTNVLSFCDL